MVDSPIDFSLAHHLNRQSRTYRRCRHWTILAPPVLGGIAHPAYNTPCRAVGNLPGTARRIQVGHADGNGVRDDAGLEPTGPGPRATVKLVSHRYAECDIDLLRAGGPHER